MSTIVMPRLSDTMEEGTILRWLKADGEQIERGEELVEIETDKATMVYESDLGGMLHVIAAEGTTLAVGQPIADIGDEERRGDGAPAGDGAKPADAPAPEPAAAQPLSSSPAAASQQQGVEGRVKASPLARRVAREDGVDLASLTGTGPGGRIVRADVLAAEAGGPSSGAGAAPGSTAAPSEVPAPASAAGSGADAGPAAPSLAGVATAKGETTEVTLTKTQQTVARRMAESKATIPDFSLRIDVDMEDCVALRAQLKQVAAGGAEAAPTYNDMVVKACALALREHPLANGSYRDGAFQLHSRVNVGVAVAAQDSLVVPTVFDADAKALGEIAREARALAARVRDGSITPPELGG
ncbi:MAG TPA: dihydrolipoamide acetyltransferase family protein, partial [Solirubrobacteraceae bacterium]